MINNKKIDFINSIEQVIETNNILVILLWDKATNNIKEQPYNNVYAVNEAGVLIWNIKEITKNDAIYQLIKIDQEGYLVAIDGLGINYTIDVENCVLVKKRGFK